MLDTQTTNSHRSIRHAATGPSGFLKDVVLDCRPMTAKHIAWFRFKEGIDESRIEHHMNAVRSLAALVPEVISVECGASYTDRAGGLTHCILVTLPNRAALPRYLEHPDHIPIADALVADIAELRVIDLDLGP